MESDTNPSRLGRCANIHRAAEKGCILGDQASGIDYSCKLRELDDKKDSHQTVPLPGPACRSDHIQVTVRQRGITGEN